jgi:hypothetical protein
VPPVETAGAYLTMNTDMFLIPGSTALMLMPVAAEDQLAAFRSVFHETWQQILEADCTSMVNYWGQGGQRIVGVYLVSFGGVAAAPDSGLRFLFNSDHVFTFPDADWLELTIAHELAHAWLFATGDLSHLAEEPKDCAEVLAWDAAREQRVWETVGRWGFDMTKHDAAIEYARSLAREAQAGI